MSETRIPRILEPAPDFESKSTHGVIQLSDSWRRSSKRMACRFSPLHGGENRHNSLSGAGRVER